jgi:hypothetical protein
MADELFTVQDGNLELHPHVFQWQTMQSHAQTIIDLKGWRGGFSSFAPFWLKQEMERCGPGNNALNYFCAIPTLQAAKKGIIPYVSQVFETYYKIAKLNRVDNIYWTTEDGERRLWGHAQKERTPIAIVYADDPNSFGSMTSIGGIADEIGQKKFKLESWRTLHSRMATQRGRIAPNNAKMGLGFDKDMKCGRMMAGSTVWNLGWLEDLWNDYRRAVLESSAQYVQTLKQASSDEERAWIKADFRRRMYLGLAHNRLHFIRFDSTANPSFPPSEFEEARRDLPDWFFDMRYRAIFRRPAGTIFESWNPQTHLYEPTENFNPDNLPESWPRRVCCDFGKRNFWALFIAHDVKRDRHIVYREYHDSVHSNVERAEQILKIDPRVEWSVAGQISEEDDRIEMMAGGLHPIAPKFKAMWNQIMLVGAAVKNDKLYGFKGACPQFENDMRSFTRPVDDRGEVDWDADPEDHETFHTTACLRYYATWWFSAYGINQAAMNNVRANREKPKATRHRQLDGAPQDLHSKIAYDARLRAGGGMRGNLSGRMRAKRYGLDAGCVSGAHLDISI